MVTFHYKDYAGREEIEDALKTPSRFIIFARRFSKTSSPTAGVNYYLTMKGTRFRLNMWYDKTLGAYRGRLFQNNSRMARNIFYAATKQIMLKWFLSLFE